MDPRLKREAAAAKTLSENLKDIFEGDPDLQDDVIEGQTDLKEVCAQIVRTIQSYEGMAKGLAEVVQANQARKARLTEQAQRMRVSLATALDMAGVEGKLQLPSGTLSTKAGTPQLILDDDWEQTLPTDYIVRGAPRPDKTGLKAALLSGEEIAGAKLSNGPPTIQIRSK